MVAAQDFSAYRKLIAKAKNSETATKEYLSKAEKDFKTTQNPVFQSYIGIGNFFMAKHAFNPLRKISYFEKGKKNLEDAIAKDPKNLETRFLRLVSQENMPQVLGYHKNIAADKSFVLQEYQNSKDAELVTLIKKHFNVK